jgi:hypothetical protein
MTREEWKGRLDSRIGRGDSATGFGNWLRQWDWRRHVPRIVDALLQADAAMQRSMRLPGRLYQVSLTGPLTGPLTGQRSWKPAAALQASILGARMKITPPAKQDFKTGRISSVDRNDNIQAPV